jgi:hypothetical protein
MIRLSLTAKSCKERTTFETEIRLKDFNKLPDTKAAKGFVALNICSPTPKPVATQMMLTNSE